MGERASLAGGRGDRERVLAGLALVLEHDHGLGRGHWVTVVDEALTLADVPEVVRAWVDGAGDGDVGQHFAGDRRVHDLHAEGPAAEVISRHRTLVLLTDLHVFFAVVG